MSTQVTALEATHARLVAVVDRLDADTLEKPAYPAEWTIAQTMSHIGSGAVIGQQRLVDAIAGSDGTDGFAQGVWDEWNAKSPATQVEDAVAADRSFIDRVARVTDEEAARISIRIGPMHLDFAGFLELRLAEQAIHTWDVEVVSDPEAAVVPEATALIVDNLAMIAGFSGRPVDEDRSVAVTTTDPDRTFTLRLGSDAVSLQATREAKGATDLRLPAEAFVRLVYGRLDPEHSPAAAGGSADLAELRGMFPGF